MSPRKGDKIVDTVSKVLPVWGNTDVDFAILGCPHYPIDQVEYAACPVGEKDPGWDTVLGLCDAVHQGPGCALWLYGHHRTERRSGCRGDAKIALGCVVTHCPGVTDLGQNPTEGIHTGDWVRVDGDRGAVEILRRKARRSASAQKRDTASQAGAISK